jgi:DNA-binding protein HU-beta
MNKTQLIETVASKAGISKAAAERTLNFMTEAVAEELASGGKVTFTGFGTFYANKREAREGVDPQTGERIIIPATITPRFRAGEALKKVVKS